MKFRLKLTGQEHVVYLIRFREQVVFIGRCAWEKLPKLPDLYQNARWQRDYRDQGEPIDFELDMVFTDPMRAAQWQADLVKIHRPPCNEVAATVRYTRTCLYCVETGVVFATVRAASLALGCSTSPLYSHLRGRPGYETVRGLHFKRGTPPGYKT